MQKNFFIQDNSIASATKESGFNEVSLSHMQNEIESLRAMRANLCFPQVQQTTLPPACQAEINQNKVLSSNENALQSLKLYPYSNPNEFFDTNINFTKGPIENGTTIEFPTTKDVLNDNNHYSDQTVLEQFTKSNQLEFPNSHDKALKQKLLNSSNNQDDLSILQSMLQYIESCKNLRSNDHNTTSENFSIIQLAERFNTNEAWKNQHFSQSVLSSRKEKTFNPFKYTFPLNSAGDKDFVSELNSEAQTLCTNLLQKEKESNVDKFLLKVITNLPLIYPNGHLNLDVFKMFPCQYGSYVHHRRHCPFYHSEKDRRRDPRRYRAEQCDEYFDIDNTASGVCSKGDACERCHNKHELLYHPSIYKQRFCSTYNDSTGKSLYCHRGQFCAFAHNREEIRCPLFFRDMKQTLTPEFFMLEFKTYWCPYGTQHNWHRCLYAHTYRDCRRSPNIGYGSQPCPSWKKDMHSTEYNRRCFLGTKCPLSHGSREQLYHPTYYKTMLCIDFKTKRNCARGSLCAFYHSPSERRIVITSRINGNELKSSSSLDNNTSSLDNNTLSLDNNTLSLDNNTLSLDNNTSSQPEFSNVFSSEMDKPLPSSRMQFLQPDFFSPSLFNLDDFESFGKNTKNKIATNNRKPYRRQN